MPIQSYNLYTAKGYAGDACDNSPMVTSTGIVEAATLGFGLAVTPGSSEDHVVVGSAAGLVFGISRRELNHEAANRPSDGITTYVATESASILREGFIYVEVTERAAVANVLANVVDATGAIAGGSAGAGETASTNVRFVEGGQVGEIVKARIDIK